MENAVAEGVEETKVESRYIRKIIAASIFITEYFTLKMEAAELFETLLPSFKIT
jgi:hypothetical protein